MTSLENDGMRLSRLQMFVLVMSLIVITNSQQQAQTLKGNSSQTAMTTPLMNQSALSPSVHISSVAQGISSQQSNQRPVQSSQQSSLPPQSQTPNPASQPYEKVNSSRQFYERFAAEMARIQFAETVNVTNLSNGKELCNNGQPCHFYYYVIKPKFDPEGVSSFSMRPNDVRNVLLVSGMHGNEYLGPLSILYSLRHLQTPSTRIILFPLANPSGFDHSRRLVYPTNIDPNRDFPIEQYTRCYQSSSSVIIDHIFRKYHIDLTLAMHNGQSEIAWNWGTVRQRDESRTRDERIYRELGEWLRFLGGDNRKIAMERFRIGTMDEVVYPVEGGFEDWAYAGEWYGESQGVKPTRSCPFEKYPFNMTNGLVFLLQLGPFDVDQRLFGTEQGLRVHPTSTQRSNGYISRAIRMLEGLMRVPNPRLRLVFTEEEILMRLEGCRSGEVHGMRVYDKESNETYFLSDGLEMKGNVNNFTVEPKVERLGRELGEEDVESFVVEYNLHCDKHWESLGKTVFSESREFKVKETFVLSSTKTQFHEKTRFSTLAQALQQFSYSDGTPDDQTGASIISEIIQNHGQTMAVWGIILTVVLLVVGVVYVVVREVGKDRKERKERRLKRKAKKVQERIEIKGETPLSEEQGSINEMECNESVDSIREREQKHVELGQNGDRGQKSRNKSNTEPKRNNGDNPSQNKYPQLCQSDKSMKTESDVCL